MLFQSVFDIAVFILLIDTQKPYHMLCCQATMTGKDGEGAGQTSSPSEAADMTFSDIILDVSSTVRETFFFLSFIAKHCRY